ncbi:dethiobiotin synthase [Ectothiorhodospira variabilis]|uniref:dethiobiotin synthase n=1 Tax=Ectothiorhodospira variabilis TaxID=505694 RepID=UPI003B75CE46
MSTLMSGTGLFITGTDTGVGKTVVGCAILRALRARGVNVIPRKPVESGCREEKGGMWPEDGARLMEAAGGGSLEQITPWRFAHALAPDRAARLARTRIMLDALESACQPTPGEAGFRLVEGAGGFLSPLAEDGLNADLAVRLGLPVLLVAPDRLGVLNHILLTAEAIKRRQLHLAGVVLNDCAGPGPEGMDNRQDLERRLQTPIWSFAAVEDGELPSDLDGLADWVRAIL